MATIVSPLLTGVAATVAYHNLANKSTKIGYIGSLIGGATAGFLAAIIFNEPMNRGLESFTEVCKTAFQREKPVVTGIREVSDIGLKNCSIVAGIGTEAIKTFGPGIKTLKEYLPSCILDLIYKDK